MADHSTILFESTSKRARKYKETKEKSGDGVRILLMVNTIENTMIGIYCNIKEISIFTAFRGTVSLSKVLHWIIPKSYPL